MDNYKELFQQLMQKDRRMSDGELVISPKGISHEEWLIANNLAVAIRIAPPKGVSWGGGYSDNELAISLLTAFVESTSDEVFTKVMGERLAPATASQLVDLFDELRGRGFGDILKGAIKFIVKQQIKTMKGKKKQ